MKKATKFFFNVLSRQYAANRKSKLRLAASWLAPGVTEIISVAQEIKGTPYEEHPDFANIMGIDAQRDDAEMAEMLDHIMNNVSFLRNEEKGDKNEQ